MDVTQGTISVLMLPWLAHGHISPFLELAKKLTKRNFHIHICSTPINLTSIKKKINEKYSLSIQLVEIHLPFFQELPPHYHTTNGLPPHLMVTLKNAYEMASPEFSTIVDDLKPDLVIYDFNQPWAAEAASCRNIPAVQFITMGAALLSFGLHMFEKQPNEEEYPFPEIYLRGYEELKLDTSGDGDGKDRDRFGEALRRSCNILLIRSCREIEGKYIDFVSILCNKKVVPVGPLVVLQDTMISNEDDEHVKLMKWLDTKEEASVVFVSFGSEYFLTKEERDEIAKGLEPSEVSFIWVLRFPLGQTATLDDALPQGFLERVKDKGIVLEGWAPQAKILQHPSTGGFVSHCGMSSVMESIVYGVPIIAMPIHLDQPLNARLVEAIGVGVEVVRNKNRKLKSEDIARVIKQVVIDQSGEDVRRNVKGLSEKLENKGEEEIDIVVEELIGLCRKSN